MGSSGRPPFGGASASSSSSSTSRLALIAGLAIALLFLAPSLLGGGRDDGWRSSARVRGGGAAGKAAATKGASGAASSAPPLRVIVSGDLSEELHEQLSEQDVTHLIVLGPNWGEPNLTISWKRAGAAAKVLFAEDLAQLRAQLAESGLGVSCAAAAARSANAALDQQRRRDAGGVGDSGGSGSSGGGGGGSGASGASAAAAGGAGAAAAAPSAPPARVAVITRGVGGRLPQGAGALLGAAGAALGPCQLLSVGYSRHADKGDSLAYVSTSPGGPASSFEPYRAAFLSTPVFRDTFSKIYDQNVWGKGDYGGGGSGEGSNLTYTATLRRVLPELIERYDINSMLDSSCGSMHWMPSVLRNVSRTRPGFRFMGTDVACSLIANHTRNFKREKSWRFACVDYSAQPLPAGYDLVWSRDSLQHVPQHAVWQFLNQVKSSGAKYLLVGSYIKSGVPNRDIKGGDYYAIDLTKPPFNLRPKPLEVVDERTPDGKHMLLFEVDSLTWDDPLKGVLW